MEEHPKKEDISSEMKETNTQNLQAGKFQHQEFFSKVQRYYNSEIESQQKIAKDDSDFEYIEYLNNNKNTLDSFFNDKVFLKKKPEDFAMAIADLAGQMSILDPLSPANNNLSEEIVNNFSRKFSEIKDIYTKACKKLYPYINLNSTNDPDFYPLKLLNDSKAFSKTSQLDFINNEINSGSYALRLTSFENFQKMDDSYDRVNNSLFKHNESVYKLFILKDQIQNEIYGRSDLSPNDLKKINLIKNEIMPEQKEKETTVYENITENNFDKYLKENKAIFFDGYEYNIEVNKNGDIFINRPISIKEALNLAREVNKTRKNTSVNTGMIKIKMFSVPKELLISGGKWIINNMARNTTDTERLKEIDNVKELQKIITETDEFNENFSGSFELLNDVLLREAERLNKEKDQFEKDVNK